MSPYVKLSHETLDTVLTRLTTLSQVKVLLFIVRRTAGFHKESDAISLSQFIAATHLSESQVLRALRSLEDMSVIYILRTKSVYGDANANVYSVLSPMTEGSPADDGTSPHLRQDGPPADDGTVPPPVTDTKEILQKETSQKWETIISSLRTELDPDIFARYVATAALLSSTNGTAVIAAHGERAAAFLRIRLHRRLCTLLNVSQLVIQSDQL